MAIIIYCAVLSCLTAASSIFYITLLPIRYYPLHIPRNIKLLFTHTTYPFFIPAAWYIPAEYYRAYQAVVKFNGKLRVTRNI